MLFQEKIEELKRIITNKLTPYIQSDYFLLDLPFHSNIGDCLIWEGEEEFLNKLPYKCLYRSSADTFDHNLNLAPSITILLHGGGNFGDLWIKHQKFRKDIIQKYLDNPIIIFPQTIYYSNKDHLIEDAELLKMHKNLTICVRDERSYEMLTTYFDNNIILLPDMAFCINHETLNKYISASTKKKLLLKRGDKELSMNYDYMNHINDDGNLVIHDWPSKQKKNIMHKLVNRLIHPKNPFKILSNYYAFKIYRPYLVRQGVRFLSEFDYIYTTRLHGAILSCLLHKPFTFFDNSYGKNKDFYEAWLSDVDAIKFVDSTK